MMPITALTANAASCPITMATSFNPVSLPRISVGATSEMNVGAVTEAPPTAYPSRKRDISNTVISGARADINAPTRKINDRQSRYFRLPK